MDLLKLALSETLMSQPPTGKPLYEEEESEVEEPIPKNWRAPMPMEDKRYDCYDHWLTIDNLSTARCCRLEVCTSRIRTRCEKCSVYLCLTKDMNC